MTTKQKQNLLAFLGYYTGSIDGIWGGGSKAATRKFQEKAGLPTTGEIDEATAAVLAEAIAATVADAFEADQEVDSIWDGIKYFIPEEFACHCDGRYCDGFPAPISRNLLLILETTREHFDSPVTISSGVRCQTHNANVGGVYNSRHLYGKAADFSVRGKSAQTVLAYVLDLPNVRYAYAIDDSYVHVDVE